jgi:carbonic anhydrase/acetyltransferase-like protein (isoleucine patch superfamily)
MGLILPVNGIHPSWGEDCFIAPNATITGDVVMGNNCSVWFNAVIRGDVHSIRIGDFTNIQDGAVIHCTYKHAPTVIGSGVSIGHQAMVHGCTIEDDVLIGMGATILDHAVVQKGCLVGAGSVVTERSVLEAGWLYAGIPARKIKLVGEDRQELMKRTAIRYPEYGKMYSISENPDAENENR